MVTLALISPIQQICSKTCSGAHPCSPSDEGPDGMELHCPAAAHHTPGGIPTHSSAAANAPCAPLQSGPGWRSSASPAPAQAWPPSRASSTASPSPQASAQRLCTGRAQSLSKGLASTFAPVHPLPAAPSVLASAWAVQRAVRGSCLRLVRARELPPPCAHVLPAAPKGTGTHAGVYAHTQPRTHTHTCAHPPTEW